MTILTSVLNAIGLGKKPTQSIQSEIAEYIADLKRANEARDNWRDSSKEWEAKFKKAVSDLQEIAYERDELRPDAQKWRNARDRRAKNRGGGK